MHNLISLKIFYNCPASRDIISNYLESCFGNRVPDQKEKLPTSTKELETLEKRYKPQKEENA